MDNKTLLMECAKHLFYTKGYDAVGVQEIVERAGLTKPTLYYYFGSKRGLLQEIVESRMSEFQSLMREAEAEPDIRELLYRVARAFCTYFDRDREFYMLMMALFFSARENEAYEVVHPCMVTFYDSVLRAFERAADQLGNMRGRQRQFAISFAGVVNYYLLMRFEQDPEQKREIEDGEIRELMQQFLYGVFT